MMFQIKFKGNRARLDDGDEGSITPLIAMYFTIAMLGIFILANVASTYVARRDLINISEAALSKAAQELDEFAYYYQIPIPSMFSNGEMLIPINCSDAGLAFKRELFNSSSGKTYSEAYSLRNTSSIIEIPEITEFSCDGRYLSARVKRRHILPFAANILGLDSFTNEVSIRAVARFN